MKIVVLSVTTAMLAAVSWLVADHAVGSVAQDSQPPRFAIVQRDHQDREDHDEGFFVNGSSLSNGTFQVPVMRSSGS